MTIEAVKSDFGDFSEMLTVSGSGKWVHLAGCVAFDETGKAVIDGGVERQTHVIFDRFAELLATQGGKLSDIVKINVFMTDLAEYGEFSAARTERFPERPPASAAVGVADLLLGAKIEIDGLAFLAEQG